MNEASDNILLRLQDLGGVRDVCIEICEIVTLAAYSSAIPLEKHRLTFPISPWAPLVAAVVAVQRARLTYSREITDVAQYITVTVIESLLDHLHPLPTLD